MRNTWRNTKTNKLFKAFLQLKTVDEVADFCRDLMTEAEIQEFASRFEIANMLDKGMSQRSIAARTEVSTTTVTRVNQWLHHGTGGYKLMLERMTNP